MIRVLIDKIMVLIFIKITELHNDKKLCLIAIFLSFMEIFILFSSDISTDYVIFSSKSQFVKW